MVSMMGVNIDELFLLTPMLSRVVPASFDWCLVNWKTINVDHFKMLKLS
jgi:hypothetical protein